MSDERCKAHGIRLCEECACDAACARLSGALRKVEAERDEALAAGAAPDVRWSNLWLDVPIILGFIAGVFSGRGHPFIALVVIVLALAWQGRVAR